MHTDPLTCTLAEQEGLKCQRLPYFGYGNADAAGNLSQRSFGKGQKRAKKEKGKKIKENKKEGRKKKEPDQNLCGSSCTQFLTEIFKGN